MKKISVFALALFVLILLPVWASAGTVEGSVQGSRQRRPYGCS
jgi:hypothetical protein